MDANMEFLKFNKAYKEKLTQVIKENKLTDFFEHVDEALRRVKNDDSRTVRQARRTRKN